MDIFDKSFEIDFEPIFLFITLICSLFLLTLLARRTVAIIEYAAIPPTIPNPRSDNKSVVMSPPPCGKTKINGCSDASGGCET